MKTDLSGKTALVIDSGMFVEFALRLAREGFGRVFYHCDVRPPQPRVQEASIGDGFEEIKQVEEWLPLIRDVDCIVFPDCTRPDIQTWLEREGYPVWGSRHGVHHEWFRIAFKKRLREIGLPIRDYHVCHGLKELREYLWDRENQFVKISKFRGNGETWRWSDRDTCEGKLNDLAIEFGPLAGDMRWLVEQGFDAVEVGYDGYFAGGKFPSKSFHGMERKDQNYLGAFVSADDLPDALKQVNEAMAPLLAKYRYANFFSTEVRIGEDSIPYFTDPTCRHASPAGEPMLEAFSNLPEIVWGGAHGECVEPECEAAYAIQAVLEHNGDKDQWRKLVIPHSIRRWVKLYYVSNTREQVYSVPPVGNNGDTIGTVIGLGDTPRAALEHLKQTARVLEGQPVSVQVSSLAETIKSIEENDQKAMEVEAPLPAPEEALT